MKRNLIYTLIVAALFLSCKKNETEDCSFRVIKVAGLFSETGELSYLGITSEAAIRIAIDEINNEFKNRNINYRFEFSAYDTQLDPSQATQALSLIAASGCKLVIGPQTSSELQAIKPLADSLGILVVSPSSTSASLAIPNDMIFRFSPGQAIVGTAMSQSYINQGKQALVLISRNDAGSLGLQNAVATHFSNSGGLVVNAGAFNGTDTDFSTVLAEVKNQIINYQATFDINQIAVLTTSFDETIQLFNQASSDNVLSSVQWYGGIGFFKNSNLLNDPLASQFAVSSQFYSPGFSLPSSQQNLWQPLLNAILGTTGVQGDALTLCAYDVMKSFGNLVESYGGVPTNASDLQSWFYNVSNLYSGTTGVIELDANGDRANGIFDFWGLQNNNGTYEWVFVGQSE